MTFPKYDDLPFIAYEYLGGEQFVRGYSAIPVNNHHSVQEMMESSNISSKSTHIGFESLKDSTNIIQRAKDDLNKLSFIDEKKIISINTKLIIDRVLAI